jgi:hypothetical protein
MNNKEEIIDKYFNYGMITSIVGTNYSLKNQFVILYLLKKIIYTNTKVLYIDTDLNFNSILIQDFLAKVVLNKEQIENIKNKFSIIRILDINQIGYFLEYNLFNILNDDNNIKTVVFNNLSNLFSLEYFNKKHARIYMRIILHLTKKFKLNTIYVNEFYFINENDIAGDLNLNTNENEENSIEKNFIKEIAYNDIVNEFCSHIIFMENYNNNLNNKECYCEILKSCYKPNEKFILKFDRKICAYIYQSII